MKIISASYEILNVSHDYPLASIERISRTCYKSEDSISHNSAEKMVRNLIKNGHEAMIEHVTVTVKFICDRGIMAEITRHRLASFAVESSRYCNYSKDKFGNELTFIEPCFFNQVTNKITYKAYMSWYETLKEIEESYFTMLDEGCSPQEARSILPNSLKTEVVMTCNLREWRHFLKLRTSKAAHPQMREIAIPLLKELKELIPVIFDDIEVNDDV